MAIRKNRNIQWVLFSLLGLLIIIGLTWVNYSFAENNPGGNDFLVHYVGTRSLLFEGISPYSDEVAVRIQTAAYGHPAQGNEHELRVAYPLYSILIFTPFSMVGDYGFARAIWMTTLELALIGMTFIAVKLAEWKPSLWLQAILLLFALTWYHAIRGVVNGNAVILIAFLLTTIFLLIKKNNDRIAGLLLAVTTIKPHLVVLVIIYIFVWCVYQGRWMLLRWFFGTLALFILIGVAIIPNWILQNIWEILKYPAYNPAGTLAEAISQWVPGLAKQFTWGIAGVLGLMLIFEWVAGRKAGYSRFLWVALLTLMINQWIGIQTDPGNFIILFPALIMILAVVHKRWEIRGNLIVSLGLGLLFFGLWILFLATIERAYQPIQSPVMYIPLPAFVLAGLYWIKWWVISPIRSIVGDNT